MAIKAADGLTELDGGLHPYENSSLAIHVSENIHLLFSSIINARTCVSPIFSVA